jgi:hypothetical protein
LAAPPGTAGPVAGAGPGLATFKEAEMGFMGPSAATIRTIIQEEIADTETQVLKLAGETPGESSVTANWQSGTGTSGETGADLVSIGTASTKKKVNSLQLDISALTVGATITVRIYENINGTEKKVYPPAGVTFVVGTAPNGLWIIDGPLEITGVLRVEVQSNNVGDNGKAIAYKYATEEM